MPKEEEKRATGARLQNGPRFKSEGAGQFPISPTMGWQLTPFVTSHDRVKIGQPPWLPQKIVGWGRLDVTRRCADKWSLGPVPEGASPKEPDHGGRPRGGRQLDQSRNQLVPRRLVTFRRT
jgi:hypothetical protein